MRNGTVLPFSLTSDASALVRMPRMYVYPNAKLERFLKQTGEDEVRTMCWCIHECVQM